jgi:hypothetical protein
MAADGSEEPHIGYLRSCRPFVDSAFNPGWHRDRADMPTLPYQIDYRPMPLTDLNILHSQGRQFGSHGRLGMV